ncbi:hypothetical protein Tsp_10580, partial [Trichinella spiralis]|uniref:hypothetical protein n=1 Tax=Trichinella spiralis TaxID=6334 RepID=UPI0001EFD799
MLATITSTIQTLQDKISNQHNLFNANEKQITNKENSDTKIFYNSKNVYYTVVFEENVVMRKEFSKLVRQTFLYSMIHKISINLGQYAICHNIAHEYPHRDPLGSHKDNGFKNIVSIDIVRSVIRKQIYRKRKRRPELTFSSGDATKLEYADQLFSAVLDKGKIDAMMSWKTEKCLDTAKAMFAEVDRVLKTNGRYIILSLWPLCAAQM